MIRRGGLAAGACLLLFAAPAGASPRQESIFMDDAKLVYSPPDEVDRSMATIKALGADRVRITILWHLVDPARPETWSRYDTAITLARQHGLRVMVTLASVASAQPTPAQFGELARAAGERYSGSVQAEPPPPQQPAPPPEPEPDPGPLPPLPAARSAAATLPRVDVWSLKNEPNQPGWLGPQYGPGLVPASPRIYRELVDAAWAGLQASGHGHDLILLGETAPRGQRPGADRPIAPLRFIRELYCLSRRMRPLRGNAATARGCPADGRGFAAAHPALFRAGGWAHHPYALKSAPSRGDRSRDNVVLADLPRLTRTLDRALRRHGVRRRLPVWITEYGYQTTPPDPSVGISPRRQAAWLAQADYIAHRNPRVASTAQFLLVDDGPRTEFAPTERRYWGSFQSGLVSLDGSRKPAFDTWPKPFHVARRGRDIIVFGQLRPPADGQAPPARLQFLPRRSSQWRDVATLRPNAKGFVLKRVRPPRGGNWRLHWGAAGASRAIAVRLRRR